MRMSCNGCRILRKGCSEDCSMRPCLQWIKSPESQANATVFLAKFYGRAGLMNLINAGPQHLRPAIFRSLLYEACGRIVNPIYGSVGLLWSGSWQLCQAAVENVLKGQPITPITSEAAANGHGPPLKAYDIRHVSKDENSADSNDLNKAKTRYGFKRAAGSKQPKPGMNGSGGSRVVEDAAAACFEAKPYWSMSGHEFNRSMSHDSSLSHQSEAAVHVDSDGKESDESMLSSETAEASILFRSELETSAHKRAAPVQENELALELTLGLESSSSSSRSPHVVPVKKRKVEYGGSSEGEGACKVELGLVLTADIGSSYKLKRS